jgi:TolB-like protein
MGGATKPMSLFVELKRRNVFRVGIAYAVTGWLLAQIVDVFLENFGAPEWVIKTFLLAIIIGFPLALIFAWAFEMTPDRLKREKEVDRSASITPKTGRKLDRTIIAVLALAVAFLLYQQFADEVGPGSISPDAAETAQQAQTVKSNPTPEKLERAMPTIAVLPFVNMSSDPEQEYFSDGITEEILNRLAKIQALQVAARTSVFSFKGRDQDIRQIGELLGVSNILEGSVRKDGEQVRITAQLIRTSDGFHLWSETYDRKLESIFAIQDDIASQIAEALQLSLGISASQASGRPAPVDQQVYDLFLRARALHRQRGEGLVEALNLFQRALEMDPDFAPAWAGLAHAYNVVEFYLRPEQMEQYGDQHAKSLAAAQKALKLDPELPSALHAMGNNMLILGEWASAETYYEQALQLDPDYTDVMEDYANMLLYSLQLEKSRQVAERMIMLDPLVPVFLTMAADLYNTVGDLQRRDALIQTLSRIAPDAWFTRGWVIERHLENGTIEALHRYIDTMDWQPWTTAPAMHALMDWVVDSARGPSAEPPAFLEWWSPLAIRANRFDIFFDLALAEPPNVRISEMPVLVAPRVSPADMRRLREHPGAKQLIRDLRLPEYWDRIGWPEICRRTGEDDFECH